MARAIWCRHGRVIRDHGGDDVPVSCGCVPQPAQIITHPSALEATLKASVEAAERGELPVQKRKAAEREAEIETLRGRLEKVGRDVGRLLSERGREVRLNADGGWGLELRESFERLKALGAEEE